MKLSKSELRPSDHVTECSDEEDDLGGYPLSTNIAVNRPVPLVNIYSNSDLKLPTDEGSRKFRLLDLTSPKSRHADPKYRNRLIGHLRVETLEPSLSFTALSYVWGPDSESPTHAITCLPQGYELRITANCHAALVQLQKRFAPMAVWVDSICINQADTAERECQIPLMGEIYSWAQTVYVWLGCGSPRSDRAMDYMKWRATIMVRLPMHLLAVTSEQEKRMVLSQYKEECRKDRWRRLMWLMSWTTRRLSRNDVAELLGREWIHRAWTLQEVVMANHSVVLCGERELAWHDFLNAVYSVDLTFTEDRKRLFSVLQRKLRPAWWLDRSANAEILPPSATRPWRAAIDLWLMLPRQKQPHRQLFGRANAREASFERQFRELKGLTRPSVLMRALNVSVWIFVVGIFLAPLGYGTYKLGRVLYPLMVKDNTASQSAGFFLLMWALVVCTLMFVRYPIGSGILACFLTTGFVLGGLQHTFLQDAKTKDVTANDVTISDQRRLLGAIHQALRHRRAGRDEDKSYSLRGLLSSMGVPMTRPTYSVPIGEVYRRLLEHLIKWQPEALAMIVDAGGTPARGGPSWVPDFSRPGPSRWLSLQHDASNATSHISASSSRKYVRQNLQDGTTTQTLLPLPIFSGKNLVLDGIPLGQVRYRTNFHGLGHSERDNEVAVRKCLLRLLKWHIVARNCGGRFYEVPKSSLYAVLMALTPERRPQTYETTDRGQTTVHHREIWEAPYDYSKRKHEFEKFCALYDTLDCCITRISPEAVGRVADNNNRRTTIPPAFDQAITYFRHSWSSYKLAIKIIDGVQKDERGLFVASHSLVGSGPLATKPGDEVFLLQGVPVPLVLRLNRSRTAFRVVGAALVHGYMNDTDELRTALKQYVFVKVHLC